jgi:hypothetical protein
MQCCRLPLGLLLQAPLLDGLTTLRSGLLLTQQLLLTLPVLLLGLHTKWHSMHTVHG